MTEERDGTGIDFDFKTYNKGTPVQESVDSIDFFLDSFFRGDFTINDCYRIAKRTSPYKRKTLPESLSI